MFFMYAILFRSRNMQIPEVKLKDLVEKLSNFGNPIGLEFHPFCIGWYNEKLSSRFHLDYDPYTLAFCVVSTPRFFEQCFLPFVKETDYGSINDPFDQCMVSAYENLAKLFEEEFDVIHDFELHTNRKPKLLVQTAGHVSCAAYYYQHHNVIDNPWGDKKLYGVSCHPQYGGWFGFRGGIIFKNIQTHSLCKTEPEDLLSNDQKIQILELFNFSWKDWRFRDVYNPSGEKYSEFQQKYFQCKPSERCKLLHQYIESK